MAPSLWPSLCCVWTEDFASFQSTSYHLTREEKRCVSRAVDADDRQSSQNTAHTHSPMMEWRFWRDSYFYGHEDSKGVQGQVYFVNQLHRARQGKTTKAF